jgi:hypothetical protein
MEVRVELVTATFVAAGRPVGVHDLARLLENLNNPSIAQYIELEHASVRPLYRAGVQAHLDAPLAVKRDDVVFANFEGPHYTRGTVPPAQDDAPALLLAPPFQIQGTVSVAPKSEASAAVRGLTQRFFLVRGAEVFDAEGSALGRGDQIVVNGRIVQMACATSQRIRAGTARAAWPPAAADEVDAHAEPARQARVA